MAGIENCCNYAIINISGENTIAMGGVVGNVFVDCKLSNCCNFGYLEGGTNTNQGNLNFGGIVGSTCSNVENCYNKNKINTKTTYNINVGGIMGSISENINFNIENCHSICEFLGDNRNPYGQIIGFIFKSNGTVKNCSYLKQQDISVIGHYNVTDIEGFDIQKFDIRENESEQNMPNIIDVLGENFKMNSNGYPFLNW